MSVELDSSQEIEKLIRLQKHKIVTYNNKIKKVKEGFYTLDDAKLKKSKNLNAINAAQVEIATLEKQIENSFTFDGLESLKP